MNPISIEPRPIMTKDSFVPLTTPKVGNHFGELRYTIRPDKEAIEKNQAPKLGVKLKSFKING